MQLAKGQIVELFMLRGEFDRAEMADSSLPDPVDLQQDAAALRLLGIDPALLATQISNLEA